MTCKQIAQRLQQYFDDELTTAEQRLVETHLSECPSCQQAVDELRQLRSLLMAEPLVERPDCYWSELADQFWVIHNQRKRMQRRLTVRPLPFFSTPRVIALVTAAVLFISIGIIGLKSVVTSVPSSHPAPKTEVTPLEKPEAVLAEREKAVSQETKTVTAHRRTVRTAEPGYVVEEPAELAPQTDGSSAVARRFEETDSQRTVVSRPTAIPTSSGDSRIGMVPVTPPFHGTGKPGKADIARKIPSPKSVAKEPGKEKTPDLQPDISGPLAGQKTALSPRLLFLPEVPDSIRKKYAGTQVPVRVAVEPDGKVSHAELAGSSITPELVPMILDLARRARFAPAFADGRPRRTTTAITVRIRPPKTEQD